MVLLWVQLLQSGELAPGIHCDEFSNRRRNLARALPAGAVAIIPSSDPILRSGIQLPYRQVGWERSMKGIGPLMQPDCTISV